MRFSIALGLFVALLAGSSAAAGASEVQSPDVAMWTSNAPSTHHAIARRHHGLARFADRILAHTSTIARSLTKDALRFIGVPYVFGGTSGYGFDCSGYVQHVFAMMGLHIPRTADAQYYAGSRISSAGMQPGDLVFFQTYEPGPSHVGIFLGNGRFVHASSSHGVMVSSLSDSYWSARYIGAKRMVAAH
ncbi:MAG: C40 family peptidase [Candidatus Eremiobacteraeota bacterium]|nr:C40 family peptidase [Candidatus Eremiobacteraeota bacterium]